METETITLQDIFNDLPKTAAFSEQVSAKRVRDALGDLGMTVKECEAEPGLRVSLVHVKLQKGSRVAEVRARAEDLSLLLQVPSIRVRTGLKAGWVTLEVGHEAPKGARVSIGDVVSRYETGKALPWAAGMTASGEPMLMDLAEAPHVLIGGQTGSGKSSHLHSIVLSLSLLTTPHDVELVFIDPKRVDLYPLAGLPHVRKKVATTQAEAIGLVRWIAQEVEFRYEELQHSGCPDIATYNAWASATEGEAPLPRIVLVIDELSMLLSGKDGDVLASELTTLAQVCRAAGVHIVASTQRPAASAIPTQLRSQLTTRVACRVATATDSRIILDATGAEKLLGSGDTLIRWGGADAVRVQGTYISPAWREWLVDSLDLLWIEEVPEEPVAPVSNDVQQAPTEELPFLKGLASEEDRTMWMPALLMGVVILGALCLLF